MEIGFIADGIIIQDCGAVPQKYGQNKWLKMLIMIKKDAYYLLL